MGELDGADPETVRELIGSLPGTNRLHSYFAARDTARNSAVVLREYVLASIGAP